VEQYLPLDTAQESVDEVNLLLCGDKIQDLHLDITPCGTKGDPIYKANERKMFGESMYAPFSFLLNAREEYADTVMVTTREEMR